ncbi:TetR/AcrR family transcriptional regulator [Shewanella kaireitica]|uniref:TetR/AcrR family transcriptional regulator n=1 Tax=Shewanella kaireitica TaxID=212021 RepID=UPI00200F16D0|nr:TetR/AcrR family transcriptional regulator [Shewanella kaireitica]MCL1092822.1 TetR/AcrR family transcriptional regulator [Shewanella kaireitica]
MPDQQIAANLEAAFALHGFAQPSVAILQKASGVSLRTLYKYYPSKEQMIIAALEHRQQRYLAFLTQGAPSLGLDAVTHTFKQLHRWMKESAPNGCMSMQAIAAFPDNQQIAQAVNSHKQAVQQFLGQQSQHPDCAETLFLIHEGIASAWPLMGETIINSAEQLTRILLGPK